MNAISRHRFIEIQIMKHNKTGMLIATSNDMKGLFVHGDNFEEINERAPVAIQSILEAEGKTNVKVQAVEDVIANDAGFDKLTQRFELEEAA